MALGLHPLVTYPLSLLLFARARGSVVLRDRDAQRPTLDICMCAYNEHDVIAAKVERLLEVAAAYGPAKVHIYADSPQDDTARILEEYADRIDLVIGRERAGKTYGMNQLVARGDGELLLFTDANVESDVDVAIELARALADPSVGCATAKLVYSNSAESPTSTLGSIYWSVEEWIKRIESKRTGLIGCDGAMFVMRREIHVFPPPYLIDDLFLSLTILISGLRIVSVDSVEVFERSATGANEEQRRKQRIACQALNVHRALWPKLRRMPFLPCYAYVSHRPVKWFMPFSLAAAMLFALLAVGFAAGPVMAGEILLVTAALLLFGEKAQVKPFSLASSAVLSLVGVATGFLESIFLDKRYTVWDPAMSVRATAPAEAIESPKP